jgi:hypothetical protein
MQMYSVALGGLRACATISFSSVNGIANAVEQINFKECVNYMLTCIIHLIAVLAFVLIHC